MENSELKEHNKFIIENNGLFLQSWEWGEFQKSLGRKIWRIEDENLKVLVIKYDLPMAKNYLYCPGGPVIKFQHLTPTLSSDEERGQNTAKNFLDKVKKIAKQEKSIFFKVEPFWEIRQDCSKEKLLPERIRQLAEESKAVQKTLRQAQGINMIDLNFQKSGGGQNILQTLILDLNKSEEELLTETKQKTRYNIRLAEKHGIKIRISNEPAKDIEYFWQLAKETSQRDGFYLHSRDYYAKQLLFCHPEPAERRVKDLVDKNEISDEIPRFTRNDKLCTKLFLAEYNSKIIAANIVMFFANRAVYLHGASSNEHRDLMSPYLLQWEQIKEAKKRGYKVYDFWGIDEAKWPGVTRFKKGFGGKEIEYTGAYDYILNKKWYWIYKIAKRFQF